MEVPPPAGGVGRPLQF